MLQVNQLCGFGAGGVSGSNIVVTAVDHATNTSSFTSWNTGTRTLGSGYIVVAVTALGGNNSTDAVSSMTIDGVSASLLGHQNSGPMASTNGVVDLWGAQCSSATGNVTINMNASVNRGGMMIWLVTGSNGATGATTAGSAGSNNPSANITVAAGGCVLAAGCNIVGSTSYTWTGISTEDYDETFGGGNSYQSGAHEVYVSSGSKTISNNSSGSSGIAMTLVALTPA